MHHPPPIRCLTVNLPEHHLFKGDYVEVISGGPKNSKVIARGETITVSNDILSTHPLPNQPEKLKRSPIQHKQKPVHITPDTKKSRAGYAAKMKGGVV